MACVALTSLMRTLELEFLQPNPRLILNDKQLIHSLCLKLGSLQTLLDESEEKAHNCEELKDLIAKIGGVALEAEYDIEAELLGDGGPMMTNFRLALEAQSDIEAKLVEIRHQMLDVTLRRLLEDVEHLILMIEAQTTKGLPTQHPEESSSAGGQSSSQHASKFEDMIMVGQTKEFEELKKKLLSSNKPLQVMSLSVWEVLARQHLQENLLMMILMSSITLTAMVGQPCLKSIIKGKCSFNCVVP